MFLVGFGQISRLIGADACVFPTADELEQIARAQYRVGHLDFPEHTPGDALLIASIVYGELGRITQMPNLSAQYPHAKRMEGRYLRLLFRTLAQERSRALLHFVGGFIGESNRQNPFRPSPMANQFGDAIRYNPGFSRARPGKHQQRTGKRPDGVELGGIEIHIRYIYQERGINSRRSTTAGIMDDFNVFPVEISLVLATLRNLDKGFILLNSNLDGYI